MSSTEVPCRSVYVSMRDGVRLAVSTWLGGEYKNNAEKRPAVMITTRYWRAMAFKRDNQEFQPYYPLANYLCAQGYGFVVADARGSGASFGSRSSELSSVEISDIGELIDWAAKQDWCDGRVATFGTSYTAATTLFSLVSASSALKLGVCRALDFDAYRHLVAPGGIVNTYFVEGWGAMTSAQDVNDATGMLANGWQAPQGGAENVLGVRPVDNDVEGSLLVAAIAEHKNNYNAAGDIERMQFIDSSVLSENTLSVYQARIEQSRVPVVVRCGWHDAGTQLGALCLFNTFSNPVRIIIGPWTHTGDYCVDPFQPGNDRALEPIPHDYRLGLISNSLDAAFKKGPHSPEDLSIDEQFGVVEYFTLGENRWKSTKTWPLPKTQWQRLYLSADHQLSKLSPDRETGDDRYQVDPSTSTGVNNRWYCQMGAQVLFSDRRNEDRKLLVYDTPSLQDDVEITGHPVVHLYIRSTATDGQFFAYLETVDPDGRVRLLTEGQLRALHRKISDETPPYKMFGPYHSLKEKDAEPLIPGDVAEIAFDLFPLSVLLKKGQRVRLAIAGADKDTFAPIEGIETPEITVERNRVYASYIDLPIV